MKRIFTIALVMIFAMSLSAQDFGVASNTGSAPLPDGYRVAKKSPVALDDILPLESVRAAKNCNFSVVLTDSYGDGWNGNTLSVLVNGTEVTGSPFTIADGTGPETFVFDAETGDMVTTIHSGASWPEENDWVVYDGIGSAIITGNGDGNPTIESDLGNCPVGHNLGVTVITPTFVISGSTVNPQVTVYNYGAEIETDFVVDFSSTDGYTSSFNVTGATFNPGESFVVTMDDAWTPADGTYSLTATVTVTDDNDLTNNTRYAACFVEGLSEAYTGCSTDGNYSIINLPDGALTGVGTIASDPFPMAEEFADGVIYRVLNGGGFGTVDPDGSFTSLGSLSGFSGTVTGLAYDWENDVMYAMVLDASNAANLCILDLGTLSLTQVGSAGTAMTIGIDMANDGYIYGPSISDENLYQYDPATGAETLIGACTDAGDLNYGQDVSYNVDDELLYTITCGTVYAYGTYDLSTGAFTQIADMSEQQYATFVITNEPVLGETYTVTFNVTDGTDPIENAEVAIDGDVLTTDASGVATIELVNGDYNYVVSNGDFCDTYTGTVTVYSPTAVINIDAVLTCSDAYAVTFAVQAGNGTLAATADGTAIASGDLVVDGAEVVFTATPDANWIVLDWYLDGTALTYTETVYTIAALDAVVDVEVTFEDAEAINDIIANVTITPNPTTGLVTIAANDNYNVQVIDVTGQVMTSLNMNSNNATLDISNLEAGLYFVRLSKDGVSASYKIIKK